MTDSGLPPGWEVRHSSSRNLPYYFNASTRESRWEPPETADINKLQAYMTQHHSSPTTTTNQVPNTATDDSVTEVRAAHLLVKHRDSRRPSSWRESTITRTKSEAIEIMKGYEARIKSGSTTLGDLAVTESDDSSARKKGDLGFFKRGQMQKEFETVAFGLKVGEVSGVVETASGVHLIQRIQ